MQRTEHKTNLPFTYSMNALAFASLISGKHKEYTLPLTLGALLTGTVSAQVYPEGIAKKYNHSIQTVKIADIFAHWLPAYLLYKSTKGKVRSHHMITAILLPLLYFSYQYKTQRVVNPIKHMMATYPGVPFWVFTLYLGGVSLPKIFQK